MSGTYTIEQIMEKFNKSKAAVYSATSRANGIKKISARLYDADSVERLWGHLSEQDQTTHTELLKELPESPVAQKATPTTDKLIAKVSELSKQVFDLECQIINAQKIYQQQARVLFGGVRDDNKRYHGLDDIAGILRETNNQLAKLQAAHIELGKHVGFYQNDDSLESKWTVV